MVRPRSQATAGGLFLLDYGTFYASKSFEIPNSGDRGWPLLGSARRGRRILWGWADETDTCGPWPACTKPGAHSRSLTTSLALLRVDTEGALCCSDGSAATASAALMAWAANPSSRRLL